MTGPAAARGGSSSTNLAPASGGSSATKPAAAPGGSSGTKPAAAPSGSSPTKPAAAPSGSSGAKPDPARSGGRDTTWLLVAILAVAAAVRLHDLGSELWYDEIITQLRVAGSTPLEILTTYDSQNQHVLYSLLARFSIDLFGDTPAALRLPAALFGVLGVAAVYLLGRDLLSPREGLLAAALLAVSDVHVWFSQDARAYSALLFFAVVASWLLVRALETSRAGPWLAYAGVAALGVWAHLAMLFVVTGHALLVLRRMVRSGEALLRARIVGPLAGFGVAAVAVLLLYAPILQPLLAVTAVEGRDDVVREWHSAAWVLGEIANRVQASFGGWLPLLAVAGLGFAGVSALLRRSRILLELLAYPVLVGVVVLVVARHHLWPRLFLFALGFAVLVAIAGATEVGERLGRILPARRPSTWGTLVALLVIALAALSLPRAYGPKQRYREAIALLTRERRPGDVVLVSGAWRVFFDYYGFEGETVKTREELEEARRGAARAWIVYTFPIAHRSFRGDVDAVVEEEFALIERYEGTLSGGEVLVRRWDRPAGAFTSSALSTTEEKGPVR